jgi:L-fucose isomerase-like protein
MKNMPVVKLGIVAVSRDCFPVKLSLGRRKKVASECRKLGLGVTEISVVIENERDVVRALEEIKRRGINALVIYLGNFGPEGPASMLAQKFGGPVMLCAAAEESSSGLIDGRGDAYCGMLNASYSIGLRRLAPYIPEYPVGTASDTADMIKEFIPVARAVLGVRALKIFSFGPRPQDFLACNAPIKPLYDLGAEIMENSELDLYDIYRSMEDSRKTAAIAREMAAELGKGNTYPELLKKLARYEAAL